MTKRKPKIELRRYNQPVFRFKRYKTVRAVHKAFLGPDGKDWDPKDFVVENSDGTQTSGLDFEKQLASMGMWGFAETRARPPVIHYWHDGKRSESELTHFFGHEMGHLIGKPVKDGWPEENRADDYGYVAQQAAAQARKLCRES